MIEKNEFQTVKDIRALPLTWGILKNKTITNILFNDSISKVLHIKLGQKGINWDKKGDAYHHCSYVILYEYPSQCNYKI